jgi:hypothetical protein
MLSRQFTTVPNTSKVRAFTSESAIVRPFPLPVPAPGGCGAAAGHRQPPYSRVGHKIPVLSNGGVMVPTASVCWLGRHFWLPTGRPRSNFVAARLAETENRADRLGVRGISAHLRKHDSDIGNKTMFWMDMALR